MNTADITRMRSNPTFRELERKRSVFGWSLAVLMFAVYMIFIFLVAFDRSLVSQPFSGVITVAFPLGLGVIALAIVLTGVYVLRANTEFDRLARELAGQYSAPDARVRGQPIGAVR